MYAKVFCRVLNFAGSLTYVCMSDGDDIEERKEEDDNSQDIYNISYNHFMVSMLNIRVGGALEPSNIHHTYYSADRVILR